MVTGAGIAPRSSSSELRISAKPVSSWVIVASRLTWVSMAASSTAAKRCSRPERRSACPASAGAGSSKRGALEGRAIHEASR